MKQLSSTLWNSIALAAIAFTLWTGYNAWQSRGNPASRDRVDVGPVLLEQVRHVNKQVFVEHYAGAEIRNFDAPEGWASWMGNFGVDQEYLMLIRGRVPAGIDLTQIQPDDIWVSEDGTRAQITLPAPHIFAENVALDLANSYIIQSSDFCPGFICPDDRLSNFQREMEPEAKRRLIEAATAQGILSQVAIDAKAYYTQLLNGIDIAEVRVIVEGYGQ